MQFEKIQKTIIKNYKIWHPDRKEEVIKLNLYLMLLHDAVICDVKEMLYEEKMYWKNHYKRQQKVKL